MSRKSNPSDLRYMARDGAMLSKSEWEKKRADREYTVLREFQNEKVQVTLEWLGYPSSYDAPPGYWDLYQITIFNWLIDGARLEGGRWVNDPASRRHWNEGEALAHYEQFLAKYTDCEFVTADDGTQVFQEVGNALAPLDPNKPTGSESNAFIGSW